MVDTYDSNDRRRIMPLIKQMRPIHPYFAIPATRNGAECMFRYQKRPVPGDGSCFFHSVVAALHAEHPDWKTLLAHQRAIGLAVRHKFSDARLRNVWHHYWSSRRSHVPSFDRFHETVRDPSRWAYQELIQFVGYVLELNILFLDTRRGSYYCGVHSTPHVDRTIIIAWDGSHFEPVEYVDCTGKPVRVFTRGLHDRALEHMVRNYDAACGAALARELKKKTSSGKDVRRFIHRPGETSTARTDVQATRSGPGDASDHDQ